MDSYSRLRKVYVRNNVPSALIVGLTERQLLRPRSYS